jgi:hypothetical protein
LLSHPAASIVVGTVIVFLLKSLCANCFLRLTRWPSRLVDLYRPRLLHHFLGLNWTRA